MRRSVALMRVWDPAILLQSDLPTARHVANCTFCFFKLSLGICIVNSSTSIS